MDTNDILNFWFSAEVRPLWFAKDASFDDQLRNRFESAIAEAALLNDAAISQLTDAKEALAFVLLLDQFPRNLYRDSPRAFATDALALNIAKSTIARRADQTLSSTHEKNFLYMPFMHSENLADQEECVRLLALIPNNDASITYAKKHRDIIAKFGRFPHRNKVLGRTSTAAEEDFNKVFAGF